MMVLFATGLTHNFFNLISVNPGALATFGAAGIGAGHKHHVRPELSNGRSGFDNAICEERNPLAFLGRNLGVQVELETSVGTHVDVVNP